MDEKQFDPLKPGAVYWSRRNFHTRKRLADEIRRRRKLEKYKRKYELIRHWLSEDDPEYWEEINEWVESKEAGRD
jgi:hypothetical protein